jgi:hypothetical protein
MRSISGVIALCGLVLVIGAALFAIKLSFRPRNETDTSMLKSRLKALGIDPKTFSDDCLAELIERGCGDNVRQIMGPVAAIEGVAVNVAWVCLGKKGYTVSDIKSDVDRGFPYGHAAYFWNILAQHHPERFGLNELDHTQSLNRRVETETRLKT